MAGTLSQPMGLSPRGRGNRVGPLSGACNDGSIPAWAGKPWKDAVDALAFRVYPRVGGETSVS